MKTLAPFTLIAMLVACGHDAGHLHGEQELITTAVLTFTPPAGPPVVAAFDDPDGDGGAAPTVDVIELAAGTTYALAVAFENRLESPPEDITQEVRDEAADHQVFFTGSAVDGPAAGNPGAPLAHRYADVDPGGLPLGLDNEIVASAGAGQLVLTLRHLPPINGTPVKTSTTSDEVKAGGLSSIAGDTDVSARFDVRVP